MKTRKGFVSNSSSSSFVLSTPKGLRKVEVTFTIDLDSGFWSQRFTNLHDWTKYLEKEYGYSRTSSIEELCEDDEWIKEIYTKGKDALEGGHDIVWLMPSSESDNPIDRWFYEDPTALIEAIERMGCVVLINGY